MESLYSFSKSAKLQQGVWRDPGLFANTPNFSPSISLYIIEGQNMVGNKGGESQ